MKKDSWKQYAKHHTKHKEEELRAIAGNTDLYHDEARWAALETLKSRGIELSSEEQNLIADFKVQAEKAEQEAVKKRKELDEKVESFISSANVPEYYSPAAILGFSIFFSVVFGGALMFWNLRKAGKKSAASIVLLVSFMLSFSASFLAAYFKLNQWMLLLVNVGGAILIIEYFWKKNLGTQLVYKRKSLVKAIVISIGISVMVLGLLMQFYGEELAAILPQ